MIMPQAPPEAPHHRRHERVTPRPGLTHYTELHRGILTHTLYGQVNIHDGQVWVNAIRGSADAYKAASELVTAGLIEVRSGYVNLTQIGVGVQSRLDRELFGGGS